MYLGIREERYQKKEKYGDQRPTHNRKVSKNPFRLVRHIGFFCTFAYVYSHQGAMKQFKFRRRFEQTLSEGQGLQLLWLIIAIVIVFLVFRGIVLFVFRDSSLGWQELISLFLDPGSFGGAGEHDAFRLIATIVGVFLFSAILISVVSNIFENIADSFENGHTRHTHKGHVLILGGSEQLVSIIYALLDKDDAAPYKNSDIVVLTQQPINGLREKLFTLPFLDSQKEKELSKRLSLYYGSRDNINELKKKNLAINAAAIYIIGEDDELDHDSINIRCCNRLKEICHETERIIKCFMVLREQATIDVYKYSKDSESASGLRVDIIDANEYIAEQVFIEDHDGKGIIAYPKLDYRGIKKVEDKFEVIPGIRAIDNNYVHLVIAGFSDMAKTVARTAAHICHFPNYESRKRRTTITFVDSGMKSKMDSFINSLQYLFLLSHYKYISFDANGTETIVNHQPDSKYGDFLDIEWEFVDSEIYSPEAIKMLEELSKDSNRSLSLVIGKSKQCDNTDIALHLPRFIREKGYPIFVHQQDYGNVLKQARKTRQFGNLYIFGMASEIQDDPLFICRSKRGQRVNFIYDQAYGGDNKHPDEESAWFSIPEAHKFSSIYCANAMTVRARSFELTNNHKVTDLTPEQRISIYEVEHRRWMMSALILGYAPKGKDYLASWKERRLSADDSIKKAAKEEYALQKKANYVHYDISPYFDLIPAEQEKDKILIDEIANILK